MSARDLTEGRIMAAALRLFARKGFGAVGIREIALEAGVSTAALYHYMRNKEDLLVTLMTDRLRRLGMAAQRACLDLDASPDIVAALARVHVIAHALFPDAVVDEEIRSLGEATRPRIVALRDAYEMLWNQAIERGMKDGVFDVEQPKLARLALMGMCNGVVKWYSAGGELEVERIADAFAEMTLGLLRASREGRPVRLRDLGLPPVSAVTAIVAEVYRGQGRGIDQ